MVWDLSHQVTHIPHHHQTVLLLLRTGEVQNF